ncbi:MAG: hypothetical protein V4812_13225 [Pseudomonadota bacterium]
MRTDKLGICCGLLLACASLSAHGAPACVADSPVATAQLLQAEQYFFYVEPDPAKALIGPRFLKILRAEAACAEAEGGLCNIGADPWLSAQDGEMGQPLRFNEASNDGAKAEVVLAYPFVLDPEQPGTQQQVRLAFVKNAGCWQLDDLVSPDGQSLAKQLSP